MALEDRCSPQSANSAPGVPQSPQSHHHFHPQNNVTTSATCPTTSMLMLINNVIDSSKLTAMDYETTAIQANNNNNNNSSEKMSPTQLLSTIASKNLFNIQNQFKFHHSSPAASEKHTPPVTPISRPNSSSSDEEEEEDEIDIENDPPKESIASPIHSDAPKFLLPSSPASPASSSQHSTSPQMSGAATASGNLKFSISQILSDNFGIESKFHQHAMASAAAAAAMAKFKSQAQQHPFYPFYPHPMLPGHPAHHHPLLFRPYDPHAEAQAAAAAAAAAAQQKMKNNFSSLFSSFQQQQQQGNGTRTGSASLEDFCDTKLSQLSGSGNGASGAAGSLSSAKSLLASPATVASATSSAASQKSSGGSSATTTATGLTRPDSGVDSSDDTKSETGSTKDGDGQSAWPAWIYCTRYSDRPSSGPRYRRPKQPKDKNTPEDKRPRTAFSNEQLARLKREFNENRYLNERRRQELSAELGLNEAQIKIWFQNKRAKIKKTTGQKNPLALQLMAQGLYNHSTVPLTKEEEELEMRMNGQLFD